MTNLVYKNRLGTRWPTRELGNWFEGLLEEAGGLRSAWTAPISVWESGDGYHVEVDLPGVPRDRVEVTFEDGSLQIVAERSAPEEERTGWHNERGFGKITRTVALPDSVESDAIDANLADGVLHVVVPKKPEVKPKQIEIKGA